LLLFSVRKTLLTCFQFENNWWYRHICALGAVVNILMMMTANLVGFAIGTEGMAYMVREITSSWTGE
jgi:protein-cysteine N-palmitoyltransferase HHAT